MSAHSAWVDQLWLYASSMRDVGADIVYSRIADAAAELICRLDSLDTSAETRSAQYFARQGPAYRSLAACFGVDAPAAASRLLRVDLVRELNQ